jgi:DNA-directed RNA polymerase specialized sigma24 family protein
MHDPEARQQLCDEHYPALVAYVRGRLHRQPQEAEDVAIDVLASLCSHDYRPLQAFARNPGDLRGYLRFLARQAVQRAYRQRQRRRETLVAPDDLEWRCAPETLSNADLEDGLSGLSAHHRAAFEFWYLGMGGAASRGPVPARVRKLKERFVARLRAERGE